MQNFCVSVQRQEQRQSQPSDRGMFGSPTAPISSAFFAANAACYVFDGLSENGANGRRFRAFIRAAAIARRRMQRRAPAEEERRDAHPPGEKRLRKRERDAESTNFFRLEGRNNRQQFKIIHIL